MQFPSGFRALSLGIIILAAAASLGVPLAGAQSTPRALHDFSNNLYQSVPPVGNLAAVGEVLFFAGCDANHGQELWRSDGTVPGTVLVKDILPGIGSSFPRQLVGTPDLLFFLASDLEVGLRLWRSDGTDAGTFPIAVFGDGRAESQPRNFVVAGNKVFFQVPQEVSTEFALWCSDGSAAGTLPVLGDEASPVITDSGSLLEFQGDVLFTADNNLWRSDGTQAGTLLLTSLGSWTFSISVAAGKIYLLGDELRVSDGNPGPAVIPEFWDERFEGSYVSGLGPLGERFSISTWDEEGVDRAWMSDGTRAGTTLISDSTSGRQPFMYLGEGVSVGKRHLLSVFTDKSGAEIWTTNGTRKSTRLLRDIVPGANSSNPGGLIASGKQVYFQASTPAHGNELWISNGTRVGTRLLKDVRRGKGDSSPQDLTAIGTRFFWTAEDGVHGRQLWTSKGGSNSTRRLTSLQGRALAPGSNVSSELTTVLNGLYFFSAGGGLLSYSEIWRSDATTAGTFSLRPVAGDGIGGLPSGIRTAGGRVYYNAWAGSRYKLWSTDGTIAGTAVPLTISDADAAQGWSARVIGSLGGKAVLSRFQNKSWEPERWQPGLWLQGPTDLQARQVLPGDPSAGAPGEQFFFTGYDEVTGFEPWSSDGSLEGTRLLKDVRVKTIYDHEAVLSSRPEWLGKAGGLTYFVADSFASGRELWATDGTTLGTTRVKDFSQGNRSTTFSKAYTWGSKLLFFTSTQYAASILWITDGSEAGTLPLLVCKPGTWFHNSPGEIFAEVGGRVLFGADIEGLGHELWTTDGTEDGTYLVKEIAPGNYGARPGWLTATGNAVYFTADDGRHGFELWRSDGTETGTVMVSDPTADSSGSSPWGLAYTGGKLFYMAITGATGAAPFVIDTP